ncbi:hypothetical protein M2156_004643 [Streptomyces sp. SAI-149]|nr:hypothetical protein [Streptomyces sp. SAI-149]
MADMGAEQVTEAVADAVAALRTAVDRDWAQVPAGRLEWSCLKAAEHIASDLIAYAGQLAGRAQERYVPFEILLEDGTDAEGALQVIETAGTLFAATLRTTPREVRAFHPYPFRSANRVGFAAMGVAEVLLHSYDIAEGLGLTYEPPAPPARVRPDPDLPRGPAGTRPLAHPAVGHRPRRPARPSAAHAVALEQQPGPAHRTPHPAGRHPRLRRRTGRGRRR